MGTKTEISWTDSTWNPIRGCSRVSHGCDNCYAQDVAGRFSGPGLAYEGLVHIGKDGHSLGWNGVIKFVEKHLLDPLKWKKPRRIFVNSMSDLFHENVTDLMRDRIFAVMALAPQHTFQILTKRPERMQAYFRSFHGANAEQRGFDTCEWVGETIPKAPKGFPNMLSAIPYGLPNVWLGVSVEDQEAANKRIPYLIDTPAAVRFLSCEPLLGPVNLHPWLCVNGKSDKPEQLWSDSICSPSRNIHWVIVGGESGPNARPMHPNWARSLRDQCKAAGVPYFFKQWGEWADWDGIDDISPTCEAVARIVTSDNAEWANERMHNFGTEDNPDHVYRIGKNVSGHLLDGIEHHSFPIPGLF